MLIPTSKPIGLSDTKFSDGTLDDSGVFVFTSNCMEYRRSGQEYPDRRQLHPQQSTPILHGSPSPSRRSPAPYSSPLPQTQWSEVPLPYRPSDYPDSEDELYESIHANAAPAWYLRPPESTNELQTAQAGSEARRRRRARGVRAVYTRNQPPPQEQRTDFTRLYPHMNPYEDRLSTYSTYSAPEDLEHYQVRSINQPEPPSYPTSHPYPEPLFASMPRSPTYPPATRRRGQSTAGADDNAFTDEEEFHLFVQATAGLGPDVAFRHSNPLSPTERWLNDTERPNISRPPLNRPMTTSDIASPLGETPTAVFALQQLPQMPERYQHSLPRRDRFETTTPGLDQWLHNPPAALTEFEEISPVDEHDDELPDYAESQAQAQAHQRAEAARRAQELQRRWQMSGSRRGI